MPPQNFGQVVNLFLDLINVTLPVLVGLALLFFIWGIVKFISKSGDAKSHADGRQFMIWSIIALFVLVSFMAVIHFFYSDLFGGGGFGIPLLPPQRQ